MFKVIIFCSGKMSLSVHSFVVIQTAKTEIKNTDHLDIYQCRSFVKLLITFSLYIPFFKAVNNLYLPFTFKALK